jgi:hypothetical protein
MRWQRSAWRSEVSIGGEVLAHEVVVGGKLVA